MSQHFTEFQAKPTLVRVDVAWADLSAMVK